MANNGVAGLHVLLYHLVSVCVNQSNLVDEALVDEALVNWIWI